MDEEVDDDAPTPLQFDPDYDLSAGLDPVADDATTEERLRLAAARMNSAALVRVNEAREIQPIQTDDEYVAVAERMRDNATFVRVAKEKFQPAIDAAQDALNKVRGLLNEAIGPALDELNIYRKLRTDYEAARRAALAKLSAAQQTMVDEAKPILQVVPPPLPRTEGVHSRRSVTIEVVDEQAAIKAAIEGGLFILLTIDQSALKKYATMFFSFSLPGVLITRGTTSVTRTRKEGK